MRIECYGNRITFKLYNATLITATDNTYHTGPCEIGFHEYFSANTNMLGTRIDNFFADEFAVTATQYWMLY